MSNGVRSAVIAASTGHQIEPTEINEKEVDEALFQNTLSKVTPSDSFVRRERNTILPDSKIEPLRNIQESSQDASRRGGVTYSHVADTWAKGDDELDHIVDNIHNHFVSEQDFAVTISDIHRQAWESYYFSLRVSQRSPGIY